MMRSTRFACALAMMIAATGVAQDEIRRGKIVRVDADNDLITIRTADGAEHECTVIDATHVRGRDSKPVKDGIKSAEFDVDVAVMFKVAKVDGKRRILHGLKLVNPATEPDPPGGDTTVAKADLSAIKPLSELGTGRYGDFEGGLYPQCKNERPLAHEAAGVALAATIEPLAPHGKPAADGRIVLLSIGMSNTSQEFAAFQQLARGERALNPRLVFVNGAQSGMTAAAIQNPEDQSRGTQFWRVVDERLREAWVSRAQVQAVWLKQADAGPTQGFPKYAQALQAELEKIVQVMQRRFPNLKVVYASSRIFAGYAVTPLNPEPYAYESGFSVKWMIQRQILGEPSLNFNPDKGPVGAPWLSWGPYLWANGTTPREDGLQFDTTDLGRDGTHPSPSGERKVAELLLNFFKTDSTTKGWFVVK